MWLSMVGLSPVRQAVSQRQHPSTRKYHVRLARRQESDASDALAQPCGPSLKDALLSRCFEAVLGLIEAPQAWIIVLRSSLTGNSPMVTLFRATPV